MIDTCQRHSWCTHQFYAVAHLHTSYTPVTHNHCNTIQYNTIQYNTNTLPIQIVTRTMSLRWQNWRHGQSLVAHGKVYKKAQLTGGGAYWAGRAVAAHFLPEKTGKLCTPRSDNFSWQSRRKWALSEVSVISMCEMGAAATTLTEVVCCNCTPWCPQALPQQKEASPHSFIPSPTKKRQLLSALGGFALALTRALSLDPAIEVGRYGPFWSRFAFIM